MYVGLWSKAKTADSTYSVFSWGPSIIQILFPSTWALVVGIAAAYRDWIWNDYGMLGVLFVGLVGAALASLAFALVGIGFRAWRRSQLPKHKIENQPASPYAQDWDKPLEKRFRVHFKNETVLIDGLEFIDCSFENVTFKYQGTRPFRFTGKNTGNSRRITTDDKIVGQTLTLPLILRPDLGIDYEVSKTGSPPSNECKPPLS